MTALRLVPDPLEIQSFFGLDRDAALAGAPGVAPNGRHACGEEPHGPAGYFFNASLKYGASCSIAHHEDNGVGTAIAQARLPSCVCPSIV